MPESNALIAAEQRIGELLLAIPKASGNQYTSAIADRLVKAKSETIAEMGYTKDEASDYQQMAKQKQNGAKLSHRQTAPSADTPIYGYSVGE